MRTLDSDVFSLTLKSVQNLATFLVLLVYQRLQHPDLLIQESQFL